MEAPFLFQMPPAFPAALTKAISKPQCVEILAHCMLVRLVSQVMRGNGTTAGHAVIVDSLPVFAALGVDHLARTAFAALSGLTISGDIEAMRGETINGVEVPALADVAREAMARRDSLAAALLDAAVAVQSFQWMPGHE